MSFIIDNKAPGGHRCVCDKCGGDCGNGGIDQCAVVSDLDPDTPGLIRNYHFCRANKCDTKVLAPANLEWFRTSGPGSRKSTSDKGKAKSTRRRSTG